MTGKPFRFRYASEIAGTFVLLSVAMLVAGILLAGRAQGWFERDFTLKTRFETEEGAFGLQEGNEVRIRNTLAGRVGKIMPMPDGSMEASFTLKNRFKQLLTRGAVANIRKKFGVAGDSFVDLAAGKGAPIQDGDIIVCKKDEEIMETAKKILSDVQAVVLPILDETQKILEHVNGVVGSVENGKGLAGALLNDQKLSDDLKRTIENVNYVLTDSQDTINETTRLVKGIQKHWLIRKYMEEDKTTGYISPRRFNDVELRRYGNRCRVALQKARTANDSEEVARYAYNLAVCLLSESKYDEIEELLQEAGAEAGATPHGRVRQGLLEAEVARRTGDTNRAIEIASAAVQSLDKSVSKDLTAECHLALASLYSEAGKLAEARAELKSVGSLLKKTESDRLKAMAARVTGRVLLGEGKLAEAGAQFDNEADLLQQAESYFEMATALEWAGRAYEKAGDPVMASDRYFRAGRSWLSAGYHEPGDNALGEALGPARMCGNVYIMAQIDRLTNTTIEASSPPETPAP